MFRTLPLLLLGLLLCTSGRAQDFSTFTAEAWQPVTPAELPEDGDRRIQPATALLLRTNGEALRDYLRTAPHERDQTAERSSVTLTLPLPTGEDATFSIVGYDVTDAVGLAAYPEIRTYYGVDTENARRTIFLDWTERGFHASIRGGGTETVFVDPLFRGDRNLYQVYRKSDFGEREENFSCHTVADKSGIGKPAGGTYNKRLGDCELMQYRTTITATGEYSNYHGATSAAQSGLVQSAVVTTINRVNQVFTRDISLRLQLVGNNDQLYNYDPATDPFPVNDVGDLIGRNTSYTNGIIGAANYDYGHIVTQANGGGVARLRASCGSSKAAGATSRPTPENDPFDIDYVAHEMGHNFGGNHTQNNGCNYSSSAGMEPGSASSVMGYAGICTPNVQNNSDDYFHGRSIEEMTTHFELGNGGCGTIISMALNNPVVTPQDDETIPAGTPFVLKGAATVTTPGNGTLTYNWEQYDSERGAVMPPVETNVQGPLFRSFAATASPERFLPRLSAVVAGTDPRWEEIPTVTRTMDFRATVINQNATYGCAMADEVTINVDASDRPFTVTDPTVGTQWSAGQVAQVRWDVAETDRAPYNTQLMDIYYSTDGGNSFQVLLTGTPNDGLETVTIPNVVTNEALIMVRANDNVFYNLSTEAFSVVPATGTPTVTLTDLSPLDVQDCFAVTTAANFRFQTSSAGGATAPITWAVSGQPNGVPVSFSANPTQPGGVVDVFVEDLNNLATGTVLNLTLTGTSTEGTFTRQLRVEKLGGSSLAAPVPTGPVADFDDLRPLLAATANGPAGSTYELQVATDPNFNNLVYDLDGLTTPSLQIDSYLDPLRFYWWRVRTVQDCASSPWTNNVFRSGNCTVYNTTAAPINISGNGSNVVVTMDVTVPTAGTILDVDLVALDLEHTYLGDLQIELEHPDGVTNARLFDRACGSTNDIMVTFDDEADAGAFTCPPTSGGFVQPPGNLLSAFDGLPGNGTWTLRVRDNADFDGGSLQSYGLKVCYSAMSLPVTYPNFTAAPRKDHILLDWATAVEENNAGFYVERNTGADATWSELGFVAAGEEYRFADRTALAGVDYVYRLRQTDLDGRVEYSELRRARLSEGAALSLFPNPTSGVLNYRMEGAGETTYTLHDAAGRKLSSGTLTAGAGSLSLVEFPVGVYIVRMDGRHYRVVRR